MKERTLHIKNMVCPRCIRYVEEELIGLGHTIEKIELGKVELKREPNAEQMNIIATQLKRNGFELLINKESRLISKIKTELINIIHNKKGGPYRGRISKHLSGVIGYEYSYLSKLFSLQEGMTIEKYYLAQKIEKVKELLTYDELTLEEIAIELDYSSAQHLSAQFKQSTGMTPSYFKTLKTVNRKSLDSL